MGAAAAERTKSNEAEATGIWIKPDKAELADDNLCTTDQVKIRHSGNHISPMGTDNFTEQEKVNPDATLWPKLKGPNLRKKATPDQEGCPEGNSCWAQLNCDEADQQSATQQADTPLSIC